MGLPLRRLTSVFDLGNPGGRRCLLLKVSEYKLGLLPRKRFRTPALSKHRSKNYIGSHQRRSKTSSILVNFLGKGESQIEKEKIAIARGSLFEKNLLCLISVEKI